MAASVQHMVGGLLGSRLKWRELLEFYKEFSLLPPEVVELDVLGVVKPMAAGLVMTPQVARNSACFDPGLLPEVVELPELRRGNPL
ncbi:hypothetical protein LWI28_019478 [Acer negundo]|uniref:Uncharacterized protein n=1 Tax=Acer negundo TaxID=4023 RepID=A0AAD5NXU3_ACENE|nr:hypothetical protein LWI28_019478 [Acer negundo]